MRDGLPNMVSSRYHFIIIEETFSQTSCECCVFYKENKKSRRIYYLSVLVDEKKIMELVEYYNVLKKIDRNSLKLFEIISHLDHRHISVNLLKHCTNDSLTADRLKNSIYSLQTNSLIIQEGKMVKVEPSKQEMFKLLNPSNHGKIDILKSINDQQDFFKEFPDLNSEQVKINCYNMRKLLFEVIDYSKSNLTLRDMFGIYYKLGSYLLLMSTHLKQSLWLYEKTLVIGEILKNRPDLSVGIQHHVNTEGLINIRKNIIRIYFQQKKYKKAQKLLDECIQIQKDEHQEKYRPDYKLIRIQGELYFAQSRIEDALKEFEVVLETQMKYQRVDPIRGRRFTSKDIASTLNLIVQCHVRMGKINQSIRDIFLTLFHLQSEEYEFEKMKAKILLSHTYRRINRMGEVEAMLSEAMSFFKNYPESSEYSECKKLEIE